MNSKKIIRIYTKDKREVVHITNFIFYELLCHFPNTSKERDAMLGNSYVILDNSKFKIYISQYQGDIERDKYADVVVLSGWTPSKHEYENVLFNIVLGKNGNIISYDYFCKRLLDGYMIDYLSKGGADIE